jgi:CBS domain-containing protein
MSFDVIPSAPHWIELLQNTKVKDIIDPSRKTVTASYNQDVKDLLKKLSEAKVLSAVVTDPEKPGVWGFVDVLDLMLCIVEVTKESDDVTKERVENLKWEGQCYSRQMTGYLVNFSSRDPFQTVTMDTPLYEVVQVMAKKVHRVAVMDGNRVTAILSQSDIANLLATRGTYIGSQMMKSIGDTRLASVGVKSVNENVNTVSVLRFMAENKLRAVPVVDWNGRMVANFSATDLLGLNETNFQLLQLNVKDFLLRMHGFSKPPVVCQTSDSVESVLLRLVVHKVHRVYIVDLGMKPLGVISLTDLMQFLLPQ